MQNTIMKILLKGKEELKIGYEVKKYTPGSNGRSLDLPRERY